MTRTPLLLLPGLLEDADAFAHQAAALAEAAQLTVADLTASSTMAELARDALRQAPPGRLAIAGHSMGGYVALEIMRQAPERVTRLALLNTNARADSAEATENRRRLMALAQTDFDAVVSTLMQRQMTPEHLADAAITATITQMARAVGREAFARQQQAIIGRVDSRPHLAKIACPTLVLAARADAIMPLEVMQEIAAAIPASRLVVVEASGHMATLEQPEAVSAALHEWLTGEPGRAADVVAGTRRPPPS
jgi:pimeloyl-ACP methyl ester carboxylesterase